MNELHFVVFDFETTGVDTAVDEPIQVAGKAYHARSLEPFPPEQGGEFCSMMRPLAPERLDTDKVKEALAINKKTKEEILDAPDQKQVWQNFVDWVKKFNPNKNKWSAPIACGKNIRTFDLVFAERLNKLHCKSKNKGRPVLFHERIQLDLEDQLFQWFENEPEPENMKMDTLRPWFGLSSEGAHDALVDVRQTGELIMKFLRLHRALQVKLANDGTKFIKFKGSCGARREAAVA